MTKSADPFIQTLEELDLVSRDEVFLQELYAALCNTGWRRGLEAFSCSWRAAGGIVDELSGGDGNYLNYYCSGGEGHVSADVARSLAEQGWQPVASEIAWALESPDKAQFWLGLLAFDQWSGEHYPGAARGSRSRESGDWEITLHGDSGERFLLKEECGRAYRLSEDGSPIGEPLSEPDMSLLEE